ncbi:hypothetical protein G4B88_025664 [Cannabis sativa]|uniref:Uncharacterized protein n=1 Tax=Cannabis sativa TaxID=3483 RepID=A0A7J6F4A1_CANSA|nr:hypothetical protein G4B88_025664 [Cannabis sativa]
MALFTSISTTPRPLTIIHGGLFKNPRKNFSTITTFSPITASSLSPSSSPESKSTTSNTNSSPTHVDPIHVSSTSSHSSSTKQPNSGFNYALPNSAANPLFRFVRATESSIERGCIYIVDAYRVYWSSCVKGIHTGQMVLRLVEAIDVYLAGTVMLIFGMGLYGLFISNVPPDVPSDVDRALRGSSLFGMFALKERPKWMKISSLDELKTKVGHVIVMILLVKMFERSKMVQITTGLDLLSYSGRP